MRDGLITLPDTGAAPVAFAANRNTIDHLPGDVVFLKVTHLAITEAGHSLPPVAPVRMISEVR